MHTSLQGSPVHPNFLATRKPRLPEADFASTVSMGPGEEVKQPRQKRREVTGTSGKHPPIAETVKAFQ